MLSGHNLVPQESHAFNLMPLDTASNLLIDIYEAFLIQLSLVDDDVGAIALVARLGQISQQSLSSFLLSSDALNLLLSKVSSFCVLVYFLLSLQLMRCILLRILIVTYAM